MPVFNREYGNIAGEQAPVLQLGGLGGKSLTKKHQNAGADVSNSLARNGTQKVPKNTQRAPEGPSEVAPKGSIGSSGGLQMSVRSLPRLYMIVAMSSSFFDGNSFSVLRALTVSPAYVLLITRLHSHIFALSSGLGDGSLLFQVLRGVPCQLH